MGFFSGICGVASAIGGAICSGISSICGAIGSRLGGVLSGITHFAESIIARQPILFPRISLGEVFELVGKVIGAVAEALGLKQPEKDEPDELGMKAEQCDRAPEDFESKAAYIKYLQEQIHVDTEKKKKLSPEMQAAYTAIGSKLYLDAAREKLGVVDISPEILLDAAKLKMDAAEIITYIKSLKVAGFSTQKEMSDYLHGESLSADVVGRVQNAMISGIRELNPEMTDEDIAAKILKMEMNLQ